MKEIITNIKKRYDNFAAQVAEQERLWQGK